MGTAARSAARDIDGIVRTAFVRHRGQRVLAAEIVGNATAVRERVAERLAWAHLEDIVIVRVPVDRRHDAKVEYAALVRVLDETRRSRS